MSIVAIAAGLSAPVLFWLGYLYVRDRVKPEPLAQVALSFALGIGAGYLALGAYALLAPFVPPEQIAEWPATDRLRLLVFTVGVVGPIEEVAKLLPFLLVCVRFRAFDEEIDGMVYASTVALGFATLENLTILPEIGGPEALARAIAAPLVHTVFASIWGWAYAHAVVQHRPRLRATALGLAAAALLHGVYDFLAMSPALAAGSAFVILVVWLWRIRLMRRLHARALRSKRRATRRQTIRPD
jgi:protease PrsW